MSTMKRFVAMVILTLAILLFGQGTAYASQRDNPLGAGGVPGCTSDPICGYLNAHSAVSQERTGLDCGDQPICGYLRAHESVIQEKAGLDCSGQPICGYLKAHEQVPPGSLRADQGEVLALNPQPETLDPSLTVNQTVLVRSGPGQDFYGYGILLTGFSTRVVGVSQASDWWVISLPLTIAPDGLGWVDAAAVSAKHVGTTCDGVAVCGYIKAHEGQNLPVFQPTYAVENLLGLPVIALTGD